MLDSTHGSSFQKKIDPDPFTIVAAVAGVIGAGAAVIPVVKDFLRPMPSTLLRRVKKLVGDIQDELRYLSSDIDEIERIFMDAEFFRGPTIRMGNGARLSENQFDRYRTISSDVFHRLNRLHNKILLLEKTTVKMPFIDDRIPAEQVEYFCLELEGILVARDVSRKNTWNTLRMAINQLKEHCDSIIGSS